MRRRVILGLLGLAVGGCGRGEAPAVDQSAWAPAQAPRAAAGHDGGLERFVRAGVQERTVFEAGAEIRQLGFMLDGEDPWALRFRALWEDGTWSDWTEVEVTYSEGEMHVARALLAEPALRVEIDAGGGLREGHVELHERVVVDPGATLTRDLPRVVWAPSIAALAPAELVIGRDAWGAREPSKVCGSVVAPYRMSVHHTAAPSDDGGDAAARMRQMQAFHIDTNNWCDIGYHFVVSQGGEIYQGRSDERRPGAHVGGQNAGNVGVSFIGNFQEQEPGEAQLDAGARIMGWVEQTYDIPWERESVRGHREWPGQSTNCPGDNLLAQLDELMARADRPPEYDVTFAASWLEGAEDVVSGGSSAGVPDMFVGGVASAEFVMTNATALGLQGVTWGTSFGAEYLTARDHRVETDWPEGDRATWSLNDANDAEENPSPGELGADAGWVMYAFGEGESKRIWVEFEATRYSFGEADAGLKGWVGRIDGVYGEQDGWDDEVEQNRVAGGEPLRAEARVDVFARDAWLFEGPDAQDTEGWVACGGAESSVAGGVFRAPSGCVRAPEWTSLDADAWDTLVFEVWNTTGRAQIELEFGAGAARTSALVTVGASEREQLLVLPMSELDAWAGEIDALTLRTSAASGFEVGAIWAQRSDTQETSTPRVEYAGQTPAPLRDMGRVDGGDGGGGNGGGGGGGEGSPEGEPITTQGCACATPGAPSRLPVAPAWAALVCFGVFVARRRR